MHSFHKCNKHTSTCTSLHCIEASCFLVAGSDLYSTTESCSLLLSFILIIINNINVILILQVLSLLLPLMHQSYEEV